MMTPMRLVFALTWLILGNVAQMTSPSFPVHQERRFISAHVGESVTLQCFSDTSVVRFYWYKQSPGQKPVLISTYYKYMRKETFHDDFVKDPRFTMDTTNLNFHLKISDLRVSDSGAYYCANSLSTKFTFREGVTVSVEGSGVNVQTLVHQASSENIQPGGSVTLSCTVHTGTCDGEHSVYWFKNSEEHQPGLLYTHGDKRDQCERKPDTQTHTCVYNLSLRSLNHSDAGTYYCAVASCGHILFGKRSTEDFKDGVVVYFMSGAVALSTMLSVLLSLNICAMKRRGGCVCMESPVRVSKSVRNNREDYQSEAHLYSGESRKRHSLRRRSDISWSQCVYFTVKQ